jgi:hypothetical protein
MISALTAIAAINDSIKAAFGFLSSRDCFLVTLRGEKRELDPSTEVQRVVRPLYGNDSEFALMTILSLCWLQVRPTP